MKCSRKDCRREVEDLKFKACARCRESTRKSDAKNREANREKAKLYYRKAKLAAMDAYGGPKCACCSEEHIEFLSLDHIEGNGAEHRKKTGVDSGHNLYYWLKNNSYPPGFRVLCMNCNFALGHNGYCPHGSLTQAYKTGRHRKGTE